MNWKIKTNPTQDKISYHIERIDHSIAGIFHVTVNKALAEEDEFKAWEMFDHARNWRLNDHKTFDADQYLEELEFLRNMTRTAGMSGTYKELSDVIEFMGEHYGDLQRVLDHYRRTELHEGLRANWSSN